MRIDRRLAGWGTVLVIGGAIPLAVRAGAVDPTLVAGWPTLWPLLLIGAGLGLVLRRTPLEVLGGAISSVTAGVMLGGLLATGLHGVSGLAACGGTGTSGGTAFATRSGTLATPGSMTVEFNCGRLAIEAVDGDQWSLSGSGAADRPPEVTESGDVVRIRPSDSVGFTMAEPSAAWTVSVPRDGPVALGVTLNAGEGVMDLAGAQLDGLSLTVNAGSVEANLGSASAVASLSATVNAGSASISVPATLRGASLSLNAGSMTLCVPAGTPVRAHWSGGLASNNFAAAGLTEASDNEWMTAGATGSVLDLNVSANAGSFTLDFGGTCHDA